MHLRKVGDLLNPARESLETLEQLRRDLGPVVFSAQYQQEPVIADGNMIRLEWFGTYDEAPPREQFIKVVQSWDTGMTSAPTSDYSVCTTWGFEYDEKKWYLLDVFRKRLDFPDLRRAVIELWRRWKADSVIIEKAASGHALSQDLRTTGPFRPVMIDPVSSKEERFNGCLSEVEAGYFLMPRDASWLDDFRHELRAFPKGRYDDQADSFSQFVKYQQRKWEWVMTEFMPNGRVRRPVRIESRPWSQHKFAQSIGVATGTLVNWEQGRRSPTGPAQVLLAILAKKPSLVTDLFAKRHLYQPRQETTWLPGGPHPDKMTPEERMNELCQILGLGLARLKIKSLRIVD